jgi:asparagine synthetase A
MIPTNQIINMEIQMTISQKLAEIQNLLTSAAPEATKVDNGVKVSATRVRKALLETIKLAKELRVEVLNSVKKEEPKA